MGGSIFQLTSGLINIARFYPWHFFFTTTHYWVAWVTIGALVVHIAAKATEIRRGLTTPLKADDERDRRPGSLSRKGFLITTAAASGAVTLVTVGQSFTPLRKLDVLAPRRGDIGPQAVPVNKAASQADVVDNVRDPRYRLVVEGRQRLSLSLADLQRMPQHIVDLPIVCVEGWSVMASWTGVRVRDLLDHAGIEHHATVRVESLQQGGAYRRSELATPHSRDSRTLLALSLNGEPLDLDHGYPCRLIAPTGPVCCRPSGSAGSA